MSTGGVSCYPKSGAVSGNRLYLKSSTWVTHLYLVSEPISWGHRLRIAHCNSYTRCYSSMALEVPRNSKMLPVLTRVLTSRAYSTILCKHLQRATEVCALSCSAQVDYVLDRVWRRFTHNPITCSLWTPTHANTELKLQITHCCIPLFTPMWSERRLS